MGSNAGYETSEVKKDKNRCIDSIASHGENEVKKDNNHTWVQLQGREK